MNSRSSTPSSLLTRLFLLALTCAPLEAQQLNVEWKPPTDQPKPPLISKVPENSAWTVVPLSSQLDSPEATPPPNLVRFAYSSGIQRSIVEFNSRSQHPVFLTEDAIVSWNPRTKKPRAQSSEEPDFGRAGPRPDHFDEFLWVSAADYLGDTDFRGVACRVYREYRTQRDAAVPRNLDFEEEVVGIPLAEVKEKIKVPLRTALINRETNLPVAIEDSQGARMYVFEKNGEPFSLPPEYAAALAAHRKTVVNIEKKYRVPQ